MKSLWVSIFSASMRARQGPKRWMISGALLFGGELHFYFDDVGDFGERLAGIVSDVVVEGDEVSGFFEALAGGDDIGIGWNGFEDFNNRGRRRQERDEAFDQRVAGAVDEGAAAVAQDVEAHQERAVESGAGGFIRVSVEGVLEAVAEEEFVSEDIFDRDRRWAGARRSATALVAGRELAPFPVPQA